MTSITHTRALADQVRQALADGEIPDAETTLDVGVLPGVLNAGGMGVLVNPPTITFETWTHATNSHDIWLVCGPPDDIEAAWERLAPAVEAVALACGAAKAEPQAFTDPRGATYPAYVVTITD